MIKLGTKYQRPRPTSFRQEVLPIGVYVTKFDLFINKRAKMALYCSPDYQINWTFGSGEEVQNRYPRQLPWRHLGFLIGTILAFFFLSTSHPYASYQVWSQLAFWLRRRSEKFLRWQPWWPSSNQYDFSYFDLLVTPMLPIKFQDNQPFVSEEAKNRFSR